MRIIGNAGKAREVQAVASGVLPSGQPVVVNADGTVSVAAETSVSESTGSPTVFDPLSYSYISAAFDSTNNKVVISYADDGTDTGNSVVGTISGTSISFGTPVVFESGFSHYITSTFDTSSSKVVIAYRDVENSNQGTAIVGTVSGTSISFGSATVYETNYVSEQAIVFDSNENKIVIAYKIGNQGIAIVGTVSGTSISFGSSAQFNIGSADFTSASFDTTSNKVVISYKDDGNSSYGTSIVGTVSGTSISFGTKVVFESAATRYTSTVFDSANNKIVVAYADQGNSFYGTAVVGTVSGTSISFGTPVVFEAASVYSLSAAYDATAGKVTIAYQDDGNGQDGTLISGTVSGTSISFGTPTVFETDATTKISSTFDSSSSKVVVAYAATAQGTSVVHQNAYTSTNLTSENYIGMSGGEIIQKGSAAYVGTPVVFESADTRFISSAFDTTNNKVVIAYRDQGNSEYSTAVVGTVSGNAISFGTPVVFSTEVLSYMQCSSMCFDPDTGKVVIAYRNEATSNHGTARVGTVSGTSISFGSAVVFEAAASNLMTTVYDTNSNKVVIAYKDDGNSEYGTAIVGTVSGTSISFGSPTVFNAGAVSGGTASGIASTFDSVNNKVILAYSDGSNSNQYTAIVGTVSGTSISFGTKVVIDTDTGTKIGKGITAAYNPVAQKVLITYVDTAGNLDTLSARVGTVSGTSISFGTEASTGTQYTAEYDSVYNPDSETIVIAYKDESNSSYGTLVSASISGTDVTFGTPTVYKSSRSDEPAIVYDSSNNKTVVSMQDAGSSSHGTSVVSSPDTVNIQRGQVADGDKAEINIKGAVDENQAGLTAGQSYYVQTDGTLSTTAGDPSIFAGTAVAATKLIVKG
jgi:hypothetical protein